MTTSAHPMIQPVQWSKDPDQLRGEMPELRRQIYQIIWDSAIACALRGPALTHRRLSGTVAGGYTVGVSWREVSGSPGYWRFRIDFPATRHQEGTLTPPGRYRVGEVEISPADCFTLGQLVRHMGQNGIGTAATAAGLLEGLFTHEPVLLTIDGPGTSGAVKLTAAGSALLKAWRQAKLTQDGTVRNEILEALASKSVSVEDALTRCGVPMAEKLARQIDTVAEKWGGLSQAEGWRALAGAKASPPKVELPWHLHPEHYLAADHPLKALRERMEQELSADDVRWLSSLPAEKAKARLNWLTTCQDDDRCEGIPPLSGPGFEWNTLLMWLCGADDPEWFR